MSGVRYVPSAGVKLPRKIEPLTIVEFERLREALAPEWRLFVVVLAHTGMRISELLGRRWSDVHLGDALARALTEWRQHAKHSDDASPVFPSDAGTPLHYSNPVATLRSVRVTGQRLRRP